MLLKELKINISWLLVIKGNKTHQPYVLLYVWVMVTCLIIKLSPVAIASLSKMKFHVPVQDLMEPLKQIKKWDAFAVLLMKIELWHLDLRKALTFCGLCSCNVNY